MSAPQQSGKSFFIRDILVSHENERIQDTGSQLDSHDDDNPEIQKTQADGTASGFRDYRTRGEDNMDRNAHTAIKQETASLKYELPFDSVPLCSASKPERNSTERVTSALPDIVKMPKYRSPFVATMGSLCYTNTLVRPETAVHKDSLDYPGLAGRYLSLSKLSFPHSLGPPVSPGVFQYRDTLPVTAPGTDWPHSSITA